MQKEKLTIYDYSCFKEVTMQDLTEGRTGILFETFKNISNKEKKGEYKILRDELDLLIKENKLTVQTMQTLYPNVCEHDKIICFALSNSIEYDVIVCTKNQELTVDLVLNGIKVKTEDYSANFVNIGKSDEKNDIYVYDTCFLLTNIEKVDFSKNTHYIPVCVLEELINNNDTSNPNVISDAFFKCIYAYNKYPENVKILNTVSSTQRGGRYSYTDLLILYSTIRSKIELKDSNITLVTKDRQLFFESMYINLFNVIDKFDYFGTKDFVGLEDDMYTDVERDEEIYEELEQEEKKCDEHRYDKIFEGAFDGIFDEIFDLEENSQEEEVSIEEKITNYHKVLPLKKLHRKNVVNLPEVIEHVYNDRFIVVAPILRRKLEKGFTAQTFMVKVGYYITFKSDPTAYYRVSAINNLVATLQKV